MTTLALKSNIATKMIDSASIALGEHELKSGRFWYKGQQNCDLVYLRKGRETIIHASGGVRFRIAITGDQTEAQGTLSLLGWLRETPNAIRIVRTILADHSRDIARRRDLKLALETERLTSGEVLLDMTEALGTHFSVKADEERLEEKDRISASESDKNFEMAVKSRWYHQGFVNFCQSLGIKCFYRSVFPDLKTLGSDGAESGQSVSLPLTTAARS
jgi:hypothetical protein